MTVRLETAEQVGHAGGVLGDLGRQRIDLARRVEELALGAGNRANADKDVADAKKPQSASPSMASRKSDGSGLAISFSSDPSAIWSGVPSLLISAAALKPNGLERELK